eukprot:TRINITY_DN5737_c0_g1_i10.p1 TRINITY_DN5737_c0_g1~~TRINITY_DN5737_c0_g1_i10.p1  ORF type:complete len:177 (-),score=9.97 TRINITY_DN5737_c0_g1_i10:223-753(-)
MIIHSSTYPRDIYNLDPHKALRPMVGRRGFYWLYSTNETPLDSRWCVTSNVGRKMTDSVRGEASVDDCGKPYVYRYHESLRTLVRSKSDELYMVKNLPSLAPLGGMKTRSLPNGILIARVTKKSCLRSHGTPYDTKRYPVGFSMVLFDTTSSIQFMKVQPCVTENWKLMTSLPFMG